MSEPTTDIFTDLHNAIKARLQQHPLFQPPKPVNVLTELIGNIENEIEKQINEIGLSVVSMVPNWVRGEQILNRAKVTGVVGISEDVVINQDQNSETATLKPCAAIAAAAWAQLMNWSPGQIWTPFVVESVTIVSNSPLLVRELVWTTNTILKAA